MSAIIDRLPASSWMALVLLHLCMAAVVHAAPARVVAIRTSHSDSRLLGVNDWVTLKVEGLSELAEQARREGGRLRFFINGLPLKGSRAVFPTIDPSHQQVRFRLGWAGSEATWNSLLSDPIFESRPVEVTVGIEGCGPACVELAVPTRAKLALTRPGSFEAFCLLTLFMLVLGLWLQASCLLRDGGSSKSTVPFSLTRTLMAFWLLLAALSQTYLLMSTNTPEQISSSIVALVGISGVTVALSRIVDDMKAKEAASRSFLRDLLCDRKGPCLHRIQLAVWTALLGFVVLKPLFSRLEPVTVDLGLLALTVISSAIYLGFKALEE